jgi:hypothetical protein
MFSEITYNYFIIKINIVHLLPLLYIVLWFLNCRLTGRAVFAGSVKNRGHYCHAGPWTAAPVSFKIIP